MNKSYPFNYEDHSEIPDTLRDYLSDVAQVDDHGSGAIEDISILDINEFLNFVHTEGEIGLPDEELTEPLDPQLTFNFNFNS